MKQMKEKTSGVPRCNHLIFFSEDGKSFLVKWWVFFNFATRVFRITRKNSGEKVYFSMFQIRYFQFFCAFYWLCYETLKIILENDHLQKFVIYIFENNLWKRNIFPQAYILIFFLQTLYYFFLIEPTFLFLIYKFNCTNFLCMTKLS